MSKRMHSVHQDEKNPNVVGTISMREIERKIRKPFAPATKRHKVKTAYRRKPKHPNRVEG